MKKPNKKLPLQAGAWWSQMAPAPKMNVIFVIAIPEYPQMQNFINFGGKDCGAKLAPSGAKWRQRQK